MKRQKQFERTDRDIINAFLELLETKAFEKITVADIIDTAMINRSTFYQHFPDKYAILESLQQKYLTEFTEMIRNVQAKGRTGLKQIDQIMGAYFEKNRKTLRSILSIKTEHVDVRDQLRILFADYFHSNVKILSELDAYLIAGLWLDFFIYYLNHDMAAENYSTLLFESYYKMCLCFFQLEENKEAQKAFLTFLDTYAGK